VIRVYDAAGNVIEAHEQAGDFKEWRGFFGGKANVRFRAYCFVPNPNGLLPTSQ
jgi:hypothetical protein